MRIVSLLPSATELVYALGLEGDLVGVTEECDHPPEARTKPVVSRAVLASGNLNGGEIDRRVTELVARGEPLYRLDADLIRELRPDLILAQDLCRVCAVPSGQVEAALESLGCEAGVVSLDPGTLDEVIGCVERLGAAAGVERRATQVAAALRRRVDEVRRATAGRPRPRTLALEWRDPPFCGGHWVPDMVEAAGGEHLLGSAAQPSRRVAWEEIAAADPEVVVFMPCGYGLDRAVAEAEGLTGEAGLRETSAVRDRRVYVVEANAFFSRPSHRVVDGVELLAAILHPGAGPPAPRGTVVRL